MKRLLTFLVLVSGWGFVPSVAYSEGTASEQKLVFAQKLPTLKLAAAKPAVPKSESGGAALPFIVISQNTAGKPEASSPPAQTQPEAAAPVATAAPPPPNKGDTAWMIVATVLVILMTVPGLALFYGGMVRAKNMLSVLMKVFATFSLLSILWAIYGYSVAFTEGGSFFGGFSRLFLSGVTPESAVATFSKGVYIPEYIYVAFQLTFAAITPCLIIGAFAERMKFSAALWFLVLWFTFSYLPIAHMVWYWPGPDAFRMPRRRRKQPPPRVGCGKKARLTLPAAQWCTSMRASLG